MKSKTFRILSPDGFDITPTKWRYKENEIKEAIANFIKRYEHQGYYSSNDGRIPLEDIADCCEVVPC